MTTTLKVDSAGVGDTREGWEKKPLQTRHISSSFHATIRLQLPLNPVGGRWRVGR